MTGPSSTAELAPAAGLQAPASEKAADRTSVSLRNFFQIGAGEVVRNLLLFFVGIMVAKIAGDEGFGKINFAQSIAVYFCLAVTLGTNLLGVKYVALDRSKMSSVVFNIVSMRTLLALAAAVPYVAAAARLSHDRETFLIFLAVGLTLFSQALNPEFAFLGLEKPLPLNATRVAVPAFYALALALLRWGHPQVFQVSLWKGLSEIAVYAVALVLLLDLKKSAKPAWDTSSWKVIAREGLPLTVSLFFIQVYYNFDITMLGLTQPSQVVGWYSAGYRIVLVLLPAAVMFVSAFAPGFARAYAEGDVEGFARHHRTFTWILLGGGAAAFAGLSLFAAPISRLLFGAGFAGTPTAIRLLSGSLFLIFALTAFNGPLPYIGEQRAYLWTHIAGAAASVGLNLWLTPRYGMLGAGTSSILANGVVLAGSVAAYRRFWRRFGR